jgi:manganese-transporting P-type ATPase
VPARNSAIKTQLTIRRRFQFSSALKRMSTVSSLPGGRLLISVKGAPETIKTMLSVVPKGYDDTYKWFTRKGSRVLALAMKEMDALSSDKVSIYPRSFLSHVQVLCRLLQINKLHREQAESKLAFAGFLVFHCPLKADAVDTLKMLADSSHRVSNLVLSL